MQINRLFEIVYILLECKRMTASELAKRFEVSTRTIYRDVEALSSAGIPIYMSKGKGGGIFLMEDFVLNKAVFTSAEKEEILNCVKAVNSLSPEDETTAIQKLGSLFGSDNTNWIEVDFSSWSCWEEESNSFLLFKKAILQRRQVQFYYYNSTGENRALRIVEPLKLVFKGRAWYLYGFCMQKEDYRIFKLRRIKQISITDKNVVHSAPEIIFSSPQKFPDEMVTLVLWLDAKVAYRVFDEFDEYTQNPDGSFIATVTMPRGKWVHQYVGSFGEHCKLLEPAELRHEFIKSMERTLSLYK